MTKDITSKQIQRALIKKTLPLNPFYKETEKHLYTFFGFHKKGLTKASFYQALLMVYGWMPTIPFSKSDFLPIDTKYIKILNKAFKHKKNVIFSLEELSQLTKYTNNSIVGLSKMLHFMNPKVYPIWDSNIARVFNIKTIHQMKKLSNYLIYVESMHSITGKTLREIEIQLFKEGQRLKQKDRKSKAKK